MRRRRNHFQELKESYDLLTEIMENPRKSGWISILTKIKPESREPLIVGLLDFKNEVDGEIRLLKNRILKKIGLDNLVD